MRLTRRAILQSGAAALAAPAVTGLPAVSPAQAAARGDSPTPGSTACRCSAT